MWPAGVYLLGAEAVLTHAALLSTTVPATLPASG
ncbi:hypothetical protein HEP87_62955 [Streptomyces sp. S1D4-11]